MRPVGGPPQRPTHHRPESFGRAAGKLPLEEALREAEKGEEVELTEACSQARRRGDGCYVTQVFRRSQDSHTYTSVYRNISRFD